MRQHIVITGAAGAVGRTVVEALQERHELTLMNHRPHPDQPSLVVDLSDFAAVLDRMPAADMVIHLAAHPSEAEWQTILSHNIIATYNVFEVARRKGVKRVIFTSTGMVYDGYGLGPEGGVLHPERHAWPTTYYAVSKMTGEHLGRMYARRFGMSVIGIRLGWFPRPPDDAESVYRARWKLLSVRDCRQLFIRCVEAEGVEFLLIHGYSRDAAVRFDPEPGRQIGYEPQDDAEEAYRQHAERMGWV